MPTYDGNLLTLDLIVTLLSVEIKVQGTIEMLAIRRQVSDDKRTT